MFRILAQFALLIGLLILGWGAEPVLATEAAWARIAEGGYTILMRHARAPGSGDPPGFELDDCSTQRNLSDRGRQSARRIGAQFAARAATISTVYSSRWCRALDTARLAFGDDRVEPLPDLDSLSGDASQAEAQTEAVRQRIRAFSGSANQVMVTHPDNIKALTGIVPREGEAIIVAPAAEGEEGLRVVGRLLLD